MRRNQILAWSCAALTIVVLVYPVNITVTPAYQVTLLDQFNQPMAGTAVSELWWQTSGERRQHLEQRLTDENGRLDFPRRTLRSALLERVIGCLAHLGREGLAASCGSQASINAAGDVKELARTDTWDGAFSQTRALKLKIQPCDPEVPASC